MHSHILHKPKNMTFYNSPLFVLEKDVYYFLTTVIFCFLLDKEYAFHLLKIYIL